MKSAKTKKKSANPSNNRWKIVAFTLAKTAGIGILLILAASLGAYFTSDPDRFIRPFAIVSVALTFLIGGMLAAKDNPESPLAAGTVNGLILSAILLVLSLFFKKAAVGYPVWAAALLHGGVILFSLLGAYLAVLRKKNLRPRRHKKRRA